MNNLGGRVGGSGTNVSHKGSKLGRAAGALQEGILQQTGGGPSFLKTEKKTKKRKTNRGHGMSGETGQANRSA